MDNFENKFEDLKPIIIILVFSVLQYLLFREFVLREVALAYPGHHDQSGYLLKAYSLYEDIRKMGVIRGLWEGFRRPNPTGVMLQAQTALWFLFSGPSRLSALTINFFYFLLFQYAVFLLLWHLRKSVSIILVSMGLFLSILFPVANPGGLFDFRIDFISFCLYGTFITLVLRSGLFFEKKWALTAGFIASLLFSFRFNTGLYIFLIYFLTLAFLFISKKITKQLGKIIQKCIWNLLASTVAILPLSLPLLIVNLNETIRYYSNQGASRGPIRAAEQGISNLWEGLIFYPLILFERQLGFKTFMIILFCIMFGLVGHFWLRRFNSRSSTKSLISNPPFCWHFVFLGICTLVPLAVLTMHKAKSPVVGAILCPPILVCVLFWLSISLPDKIERNKRTIWSRTQIAFGILVLLVGAILGIDHFSMGKIYTQNRNKYQKITSIDTSVGNLCSSTGALKPKIIVDTIVDFLEPQAIASFYYEKSGCLIWPTQLGRTNQIFPVQQDAFMSLIPNADLALLTSGELGNLVFPYNQFMENFRPTLRSALESKGFFIVANWSLSDIGNTVTLYCAPRLNLKPGINLSGDSGGWITSNGFSVKIPSFFLSKATAVSIEGKIPKQWRKWLGKRLPRPQVKIIENGSFKIIPGASIVTGSDHYKIVFPIPNTAPNAKEFSELLITFDHYFIPYDIGINSDHRKLVVPTPTNLKFDISKEEGAR